MTYASADGARIHSRTGGRGSPLFFVWAGTRYLRYVASSPMRAAVAQSHVNSFGTAGTRDPC